MTASADEWLALPQVRVVLQILDGIQRTGMPWGFRREALAVAPEAFTDLGLTPALIRDLIRIGLIGGTDAGIWLAELGERCLMEYLAADGQAPAPVLTVAESDRVVPCWNPRTGELRVRGFLVKHIPRHASAERRVLQEFAKEWTPWVLNPWLDKRATGQAARAAQRLRCICRNLNMGRENELIDFVTLDSARYIGYKLANDRSDIG